LAWWVWVVFVCLVVAGSLLPGTSPAIAFLSRISDTLLHFLAYLVLGLLPIMWAQSRREAIFTALCMVALGLALECGQTFVPGRAFQFKDFLADDLGVLSGVLVGVLLVRFPSRSAH
jgi:VanZ family protein